MNWNQSNDNDVDCKISAKIFRCLKCLHPSNTSLLGGMESEILIMRDEVRRTKEEKGVHTRPNLIALTVLDHGSTLFTLFTSHCNILIGLYRRALQTDFTGRL
jgi:hypothetical protein